MWETSVIGNIHQFHYMGISISPEHKKVSILEFSFFVLSIIYYTQFEMQDKYGVQFTFLGTAYCLYIAFRCREMSKLVIKGLIATSLISVLFMLLTDTATVQAVANRTAKVFFSKYSQFFQMAFPALLFYRTITTCTRKMILCLVAVGLTLCLLVSFAAIKVASIDPEILHQTDTEKASELGFNVAGYYFIYVFCFFAIISVILWFYSNNKLIKYASIALFVFSIDFLFVSQFSLAIVTTALSCFYYFYSFSKSSATKLGLILGAVLIVLVMPSILDFIISISDGNFVKERMGEMRDFFATGKSNEDSDMGGRLNLYWLSIKAFISSPILGNRYLGFDGHATWLTVPCDIGIFGAYLTYKLMTGCGKLIKRFSKGYAVYYKPLFCQIILMGLTNPVHAAPSYFLALWYICPLSLILFAKQNNYEEKK